MNTPRDHHFIPAFFLKQWVGSDGKLIEYSIKYNKLIAKSVGPQATGYEYDLYAFPELSPELAQYLEQKFFDYADRTASNALHLHLANASRGAWDQETISGWSRFIIALHLRHPDAMPELRTAAQSIWEGSGAKFQQDYEAIKKPEDPPTFDEYLATHDPLTGEKMRVNLIIKALDNDVLGLHLNNMHWGVIDVPKAKHRFLLSDRPVAFFNMREPNGYVALPIAPTKLFVAVNDSKLFRTFAQSAPEKIVRLSNSFIVPRARKYVWANDDSQASFVQKHMSKGMESTPLFPGVGWAG
jgi:hypothetical protein